MLESANTSSIEVRGIGSTWRKMVIRSLCCLAAEPSVGSNRISTGRRLCTPVRAGKVGCRLNRAQAWSTAGSLSRPTESLPTPRPRRHRMLFYQGNIDFAPTITSSIWPKTRMDTVGLVAAAFGTRKQPTRPSVPDSTALRALPHPHGTDGTLQPSLKLLLGSRPPRARGPEMPSASRRGG